MTELVNHRTKRIVSRVLCRPSHKRAVMIIHLGQALPSASSDRTRRHRASYPYPTCGPQWEQVGMPLYLVLLRVGFTELPMSPLELVRSYRTVSPLPGHCVRRCCRQQGYMQRFAIVHTGLAVYFLWHFP